MPSIAALRRASALALAISFLLVVSCKRRDETQPVQAGYGYPPPQGQGQGYPPPAYPPPAYPPPATRASMPPAFGFLCATDHDVQCPFGHCIGGHCGGCQDASQCKPGAT